MTAFNKFAACQNIFGEQCKYQCQVFGFRSFFRKVGFEKKFCFDKSENVETMLTHSFINLEALWKSKIVISVTRWLNYCIQYMANLQQLRPAQQFAQVISTFLPNTKQALKKGLRFLIMCQSGKTSPNLVTLIVMWAHEFVIYNNRPI